MTYCVALELQDGLVFVSDSRTNAGPDQVSVYSKMYHWGRGAERQIVLLSAGNLATTQAVAARIERDIDEAAATHLFTTTDLNATADYIGQVSREEQAKHTGSPRNQGFKPEASFILGGQIVGRPPQLHLIYPEGNHIRPSHSAPFLQIGEIKYGKPILDRIIRPDTPVEHALRCVLVSMDSTIRSNATVGPPVEVLLYRRDRLALDGYLSLDADDPYLALLRRRWNEKLMEAFEALPMVDLERMTTPPERL